MQGFSILSNHGRLLAALLDEPSADGPRLATRMGVSLSTARQVLRDLQRDGFVTLTRTESGKRFVIDGEATRDVHGVPLRARDISVIENSGIHGLLAVLYGSAADGTEESRRSGTADVRLIRGEQGG